MRAWKHFVLTAALLLLSACGSEPTAMQSRPEAGSEARRSTNGVLTVGVFGPTQAEDGGCYLWSSTVSGGTAPYQYSWWGMTTADNTSDSVWGSVNGEGYAYIVVNVTDANGWKGSAYMWVYKPASSGSGSGCA